MKFHEREHCGWFRRSLICTRRENRQVQIKRGEREKNPICRHFCADIVPPVYIESEGERRRRTLYCHIGILPQTSRRASSFFFPPSFPPFAYEIDSIELLYALNASIFLFSASFARLYDFPPPPAPLSISLSFCLSTIEEFYYLFRIYFVIINYWLAFLATAQCFPFFPFSRFSIIERFQSMIYFAHSSFPWTGRIVIYGLVNYRVFHLYRTTMPFSSFPFSFFPFCDRGILFRSTRSIIDSSFSWRKSFNYL